MPPRKPDANGVLNDGILRNVESDAYPEKVSVAFPGGETGEGYILIDCTMAEMGTLSVVQLENNGGLFAVIGLALDTNRALYVPYTAEMCRESSAALLDMAATIERGYLGDEK